LALGWIEWARLCSDLRKLDVSGLANAKTINPENTDMVTNDDQSRRPEPIDRSRLVTSVISSMLILALCLFVPAGMWPWFRGWLFLVVVVAASVVITLYLLRTNPDVVAARINCHEGTKRLDLIMGMIFMCLLLVLRTVREDGMLQEQLPGYKDYGQRVRYPRALLF
jgi:hypothetical protein